MYDRQASKYVHGEPILGLTALPPAAIGPPASRQQPPTAIQRPPNGRFVTAREWAASNCATRHSA